MNKFRAFFTLKKIIILAVAALVFSTYFIFWDKNDVQHQYITVQKQDILHEVDVTGRVKPAEKANLSFESGGRVALVIADVGDMVQKGDRLVLLESSDLSAQLREAEAVMLTEEARLDNLLGGAKTEEIKVQEVKVQNAKVSLIDKEKALINYLKDSFTKSDDAVRNKVDQIFDNPRFSNPILKFRPTNTQYKTDIELERPAIENILNIWKAESDQINLDSNLGDYVVTFKDYLNRINLFLDKTAFAVNNALPDQTITQTTLDLWRANISTARTNVNTAINNLASADESVKTAQSILSLEESQLELKISGATPEEITVQRALLDKASASVDNIRAKISKTILYSPISGIVTKQDAKAGEVVGVNAVIATVISDKRFEIETNIPEVDIADVKAGDFARITLDTYGSDAYFDAEVFFIEPAETIIEGVATYKVRLAFLNDDERIRSGMTANVTILTAQKNDVLSVPQRAVVDRNGAKIVRVLGDDGSVKEVEVKIGLRGSLGNIEIIEGVNEGDKVVTFFSE